MNKKITSFSALPPFAFFGTPEVARDTLVFLLELGIEPAVIITNPPAPKGRGMEIVQTEVAKFASEHNIPTLTPRTLTTENIQEINTYNCTFAVVVAYGKIFPEALIKSFPNSVVNIHYSLLPKYRGASPVETAIANGETMTGVSLQYMAKAIDSGDIIASTQVPIGQMETSQELFKKLIRIGVNLLYKKITSIATGTAMVTVQDMNKVTYALKIQKDAGLLSKDDNVETLWNKYRAYGKKPGVYFYATRNGKHIRVKVRNATYRDDSFIPLRVTPEGKNEQKYDDFSRAGWQVELP